MTTNSGVPASPTDLPPPVPAVPGGSGSDHLKDILPIKPLVDIPVGLPPWAWALLLVLLVLAGVGIYLWYRRRKERGTIVSPGASPVSPHLAALAALRDLDRDTSGLSDREYYFRLTMILRGYLEDRLGFPAREMTVQEILPAITAPPEIQGTTRERIVDLLQRAEPVKFAGVQAGREMRGDDLGRTEEVIRHLEAAIRAAETEEVPTGETVTETDRAGGEGNVQI